MAGLARLAPLLSVDALYPSHAAYMARTDLHQTRAMDFAPYNLDSITALLMGVINGRPAVRHRACVSEEGLALFDRAGLDICEDLRVYETGEEAERHADELIEQGYKLFWPYPLAERRFADESHLVTPQLWARLNAKEYLDTLAPRHNLAPRMILPFADARALLFRAPLFLKAGGETPTGSGYSVRYCSSEAALQSAIDLFESRGDSEVVIVEEALEIATCWCASIAVTRERASYIGAAEQLFEAPAQQSGSVIDAARPLPAGGVALAVAVGDGARRQGFVGLAGIDIGLATDGRLIVFDPNFRLNASSAQVLLHDSAARRGDFGASVSVDIATEQDFSTLAKKLGSGIDDGWFVPTRLINASLQPLAEGKSACTGFVLGVDRAQAFARRDQLALSLGAEPVVV